MILELGYRRNKAANVVVNVGRRTCKAVDRRLNSTRRHIAGRPEDIAEDEGEVYDVAHNKADILLAKERVEPTVRQWMKARSPILVMIIQPRSSRHRCAISMNEYRLVKHSLLINKDACCAYLDGVFVGDPHKS